jgi:DNA-binding transcriptional ArsR family regulator
MARMSRLTNPSEMPREVSSTIEIIGNRARTEILHWLSLDDTLTATELAERLGATRAGTHGHLVILERAGLIAGDLALDERQGRTVHWAVNSSQVRGLAQAWSEYAVGH